MPSQSVERFGVGFKGVKCGGLDSGFMGGFRVGIRVLGFGLGAWGAWFRVKVRKKKR